MDRIDIWQEGEYKYPLAFGFRPNLRAYLIDDGETRPCMMVLPGGGYAVAVPPEGELVAKRFNELGYNCFVMTYTTNQLLRVPVMDQAMRDLARAVRFVRKNAGKYRIDPSKLCVCGFSAAGHVCASLCDYWDEMTDSNPEYKDISCRPDAAILSYPVITSGGYAHKDSFRFLLGADIYDRDDEEAKYLLDRYSLEKHVRSTNPPCFIWQTEEDNLVPVKNSYLYADALKAAGVPYKHVTFEHGFHGLSIPNEDWKSGNHGEPYTAEQSFALVNAIKAGLVEAPENGADSLLDFLTPWAGPAPEFSPEVLTWPELADEFIKNAWCREALMTVTLRRAESGDMETVWKMQIEAFRDLLDRYQDFDVSPGAESLEKVMARFEQPWTTYYYITAGETNIGAVRVTDKKDGSRRRISPIFIMKEYRGRGYAQETILALEEIYGEDNWALDTILQEEGNCHLYEKMGYHRTGVTEKINDRMDIVFYEKG